MRKFYLMKNALIICIIGLFFLSPILAMANTGVNEEATEITAAQAEVSEQAASQANNEATENSNQTGTLIEIGNTTAEETTMIIRTTENSQTIDQTVQINKTTAIVNQAGGKSDLSDWVAGDQISFIAKKFKNSGELIALRLKNISIKAGLFGKNGWVKAVRAEQNQIDVEWQGKVYTLNTSGAKLVAGTKNPAALADFQVGDRVRARVADDGDGNNLTWNAKIIVVLRRGNSLFMRVTRWVVPAEITSIPENTSAYPLVIGAKVLASKFYQAGDVNNLIGAPGTAINIQVGQKTVLVRRYLGRATIGEFMEGDQIRIVGRLDETTGNIDAVLIKNNSIQRLGVSNRVSQVKSIDAATRTMVLEPIATRNPLTGKRKKISDGQDWTVTVKTDAKIVKAGAAIMLADIIVGDIVRVRGTANRVHHTITADAISVATDKFAKLLE